MTAAGHNILHSHGNEKGMFTLTNKSLVVVFFKFGIKQVYNLVFCINKVSVTTVSCTAAGLVNRLSAI